MSALSYRDGSYFCVACDERLHIPPGACVRQSFTTVKDGQRERLLLVDGNEAHRCADGGPTGLSEMPLPARRR